MDTQAMLRDLTDRLATSASVRAVYGEPVVSGERTVVPVAKVCYAFGAGGGRGRHEGEGPVGGGGGGGGSVAAWPAGALEVTPGGTRFIPFHDFKLLGIALAAGFAMGAVAALLARRR
ncbi:MAG TPA: spore germination protein GerW family protein [Candidatus Sulfopaludibacter sp.]|nr:spore germination protein GerW family protein [Candidatus Sulfopaludibacter sp.]